MQVVTQEVLREVVVVDMSWCCFCATAASGDYNPIHTSAFMGRAFGFPGAIVHGMWELAW